MRRRYNAVAFNVGIFIAVLLIVNSCTHEPFLDPGLLNDGNPTTPGCVTRNLVCFESSVLPIFQSSCAKPGCHDASTQEAGFVLSTYASIVRRGIKPGNATESKLYKVLFENGEDAMPPGSPLTKAQKDSIKVWIDQGAKNTVNCNCFCDENQFTYKTTIQPILQTACVGCHKPGSLSGNIDLSTYSNVLVQVNNGKLIGSVTHATGYKPMPQSGKLTDCTLTQIKNWIDAGALNN